MEARKNLLESVNNVVEKDTLCDSDAELSGMFDPLNKWTNYNPKFSLMPTKYSGGKFSHALREKLTELASFRGILSSQVDSLQMHFNICTRRDVRQYKNSVNGQDVFANLNSSTLCDADSSATGVDFKRDALTFKATASALLTAVEDCIDMMQQRETGWRRRLSKETDRRCLLNEEFRKYRDLHKVNLQKRTAIFGSTDFQSGPNSVKNEEEWHDAMDVTSDQIDAQDVHSRLIMLRADSTIESVCQFSSHSLSDEVDRLTMEQLNYAKAGVEHGVWQLFADEGEMKMYKRDLEIDGIVCDPLKAVHSVRVQIVILISEYCHDIQGITAREYLHYFYEPTYKMDWDTTLEQMHVVDQLNTDTVIVHQVHKRVWPAAQRESLFWSHLRRVDERKDSDAVDLYIVCNHDCQRSDVALFDKQSVRVNLTVAMVCQTVVNLNRHRSPTRDDILCKIIYVSQVNPGGWAPSSILRLVYKKEYPKFLKRFTKYVQRKTMHTPIVM